MKTPRRGQRNNMGSATAETADRGVTRAEKFSVELEDPVPHPMQSRNRLR